MASAIGGSARVSGGRSKAIGSASVASAQSEPSFTRDQLLEDVGLVRYVIQTLHPGLTLHATEADLKEINQEPFTYPSVESSREKENREKLKKRARPIKALCDSEYKNEVFVYD